MHNLDNSYNAEPAKEDAIKNIDYALVAKGHSPMYVMHKFWARKPHNVVSEYIENYSRPGDLVLDPFVGSGVTSLEAVKLGRKAIGIDLNPMAIFISRMTGKPADLELIRMAFTQIAEKCQKTVESFYETDCPGCGKPATILASVWDRVEDKVKEIRYSCLHCKKKLRKKPSNADLAALRKLSKKPIRTWYPKDEFPNGITFNQGRREAGPHFYDLFTKRNLRALSLLWEAVQEVTPESTRQFMSFAFTSMVHLSSKMTPVRKSRPFSSFWAINSYWVPPEYMESNVWMLYDNAVNKRQGLIPAKEDSNGTIEKWKEAKRFEDLEDGANILLKVHNALELPEIVPDNSIDYVFTDPPYGGAVPYAELCTMWALWKGFKTNYADEITINDEKNSEYYRKMLQAAFLKVHRVLKSGKYLTVTFHSTDIKVWNSIINAVALAGFDLEEIVYQPPARASAKGLLVPYGSAVGDYYIRFRKPQRAVKVDAAEVSEEQYEKAVVEAAKKILAQRGEPTPYTYILNGIIVELKQAGALLAGKKNPNKVMRVHEGKEFVLVDEKDKETGKVLGKKWWFKDPASIPYLDQVPLSDRLETAVIDVLHRNIKVSFDDVLQEVFIKFPNALTPETQKVRDVLEEYADQTSDGKWALKPMVHARESEHSRIISILVFLARKAGYLVAIGSREQSEVYDGKKLGSLASTSGLDLRGVPEANADRIRQIDVIWFDKKGIRAIFEVENTTAITEAIVRGSNLPSGPIKRFLILPEERERLLHRKMQEPMLAERLTQEPWDFIFYRDLVKLSENRKKVTISLTDMADITSDPKIPKGQLALGFNT
ncbi:MAG: DNA methyltransferase [Rhabdochlamydiaceae bacterium]